MYLERLRIQNLRVLGRLEIGLSRGRNWIIGGNGAGKSSVIESIFMLSRGDSFRKGRARRAIREGAQAIFVYGEVRKSGDVRFRIGFEKTAKGGHARVNGNPIKRTSDLARYLPVQLVTPNSHEIIEKEPTFRRKLLDWGVFHVEPSYQGCFVRYQRALSQRNAALRQKQSLLSGWDAEMAETGELINRLRASYIKRWQAELDRIGSAVPGFAGVTMNLKTGWRENESLMASLEKSRSGDRERGFTTVGIHRADLGIAQYGAPIASRFSRGQQKMLICVIRLAQGVVMAKQTGDAPVMLIDDFFSELDDENGDILWSLLRGYPGQSVLTSVRSPKSVLSLSPEDRLFHVEQGAVREIT